jgi:hypothetical protein
MSELQPVELDALEDFLEGLEDDGVPASVGIDDPQAQRLITQRLTEYRTILRVCREALPLEDVPAGVLDGVLEEARRSSVAAAPSRQPSLWQRLRRSFVIPGLALAAAAALVIVMVRPGAMDEAASTHDLAANEAPAAAVHDDSVVDPEPADGRLADANLQAQRQLELESEARGGGVLDSRVEPPAEEEADISGESVDGDRVARDPASSNQQGLGGVDLEKREAKPAERRPKSTAQTPSPAKKAPSSSKDAPPPPMPKPAAPGGAGAKSDAPAAGANVDVLWKAIDAGDAQRRGGKCSAARASYEKVLQAGASTIDKTAMARALAGLGLCEVEAGKQAAADAHFASARTADPNVGKFIEAELARTRK